MTHQEREAQRWLQEAIGHIDGFVVKSKGWLRPACVSHLCRGFGLTEDQAVQILDEFYKKHNGAARTCMISGCTRTASIMHQSGVYCATCARGLTNA